HLLAQQERYEEAILLYEQTERAFEEDGMQPSLRTTDLAARLRHTSFPHRQPTLLTPHLQPTVPEPVLVNETSNPAGTPGRSREASEAGLPFAETSFPGIPRTLFES